MEIKGFEECEGKFTSSRDGRILILSLKLNDKPKPSGTQSSIEIHINILI
jgi:hypothetical protein